MLRLPQSGEKDPRLMSNDRGPVSELVDVRCEFMGVEWKKGGGRRQSALVSTCVCAHSCMICFNFELVPLNGDASKNYLVQQICRT